MRTFIVLLLLPCAWLSAIGAPVVTSLTVQGAIKLIPKDQAKNIVRIEARDGTPAPDRWYIQIYDPTAENGLREFVVFQKALVASRTISQFLDGAKPGDVVGAKLVKIDSDDLIKIVQQYVEANNLDVAKIDYTMSRDEGDPSPVWKLSCFDDSGKKLAGIIINARNASVISHDGFDLVPGESAKPAIPVAVASTPTPPPAPPAPVATPPPSTPPPAGPVVKPAIAVLPATAVAPPPVPRAVAVASAIPLASASPGASPAPSASPTPKPKRSLFQRMFGGKPTPSPSATIPQRNH